MSNNFSPIQNHIISKLKNAILLRYSDLWPSNTPNDLFNYHLQFLVKKGFVTRSKRGYSLSGLGIQHVADPDVHGEQIKIASLFKINVITIVSKINNGKIEILSQKRMSHPSYGKVGVMGGIVRKGEPLEMAATRKLKIETGLDATLRHVGIERRMMYVDGKLFSDVVFPITYTSVFSGELQTNSEYGHNEWISINKAIRNESTEFDSIKKIVDVLKAIKDETIDSLPFFYEEDTQIGP